MQHEETIPTIIRCNNMSTIAIFHNGMKCIEIQHHFIRYLDEEEEIQLEFVNTKEQLENSFAKSTITEKQLDFKSFSKFTN